MNVLGLSLNNASRISSAAARMRSAVVAMGIVYLLGNHVSVFVIRVALVAGMYTM